jgi:hypothetical protein
MTSFSAIQNFPKSFVPTPSPCQYEPPRLTKMQQAALSDFFAKRLCRKINNWNILPATYPIWDRCISILIKDYEKRISLSSPDGYIAKRAVEILKREKEKGAVKRFFCEHLLTGRMEINIALMLFIRGIDVNQCARYTCLVPSAPECIVDCSFKVQDAVPAKSDVTKSIEEIDLWLIDTISNQNNLKHIPETTYIVGTSFNVECETLIALPSRFGSLEKSILNTRKVTLLKKVQTLPS